MWPRRRDREFASDLDNEMSILHLSSKDLLRFTGITIRVGQSQKEDSQRFIAMECAIVGANHL